MPHTRHTARLPVAEKTPKYLAMPQRKKKNQVPQRKPQVIRKSKRKMKENCRPRKKLPNLRGPRKSSHNLRRPRLPPQNLCPPAKPSQNLPRNGNNQNHPHVGVDAIREGYHLSSKKTHLRQLLYHVQLPPTGDHHSPRTEIAKYRLPQW